MATLLLALRPSAVAQGWASCSTHAVGGTGRKTGVALAADLLVAVVLRGEDLERGLNDTTTETEDEVEGRLLLDVCKC